MEPDGHETTSPALPRCLLSKLKYHSHPDSNLSFQYSIIFHIK